MYGFKPVGKSGESPINPYTSGAAIAVNDPVTQKTDGQVEKAAAGDLILGVAIEAATASGQTIHVLESKGKRLRFLASADNVGTTLAASHEGGRFDIIGNSGEVLIDSSTVAQTGTETGQVKLVEFNPQGHGFDTDTTVGLFEIVEEQ